MGTELCLRIWSDLAPVELWARLIDAIDQWDAMDGAWQGLRIVDERLQSCFELQGDAPSDVIKGRVADAAQPDRCFRSGIAFRCWRNVNGKPTTGHGRLGVEVWGSAWRLQRDRRIEGQACLWIPNVGPYLAGKDADPGDWNARAELNNESLTQLLFAVIDAVLPAKLTLATESGLPIPVNVHAVWHRERAGFITDIAFMRDLAEHGLPAYALPPLLADSTPDDAAALHEWRSPEARRLVWERLRRVFADGYAPTVADVDRELASGQYYFYERRGGVLLVAYPYLLDSFVDRFLLGIIAR